MTCKLNYTFAICLFLAALLPASGQDDSETIVGGRPLENVIVNRDMYVRIIAESRFTEDDKDLLGEDVNYERFPSRIYDTQIMLAGINRFRITSAYSFWKNKQDLDITRKSLSIRVPLSSTWSIYPRYLLQKEEDVHKDYYQIAAGGWLKTFYTYTQYQSARDENDDRTSQVYQYLSWQPANGSYRMGAEGSVNTEKDSNDLSSWHAKVFTSFPIVKDLTYLHLSGLYLDYIDILQYNEYEASIYQIVGDTTTFKLSYRYYEDTNDLYSHAYGIKVKHYFVPRLGVYVGYRRYDHSEGAGLDTAYGGFNLLL